MLLDTEKDVGGAPVQTSFQLSAHFRGREQPSILLERGMHKPSTAECRTPFYPDRSQRIVALSMLQTCTCLVFSVEALLRLAEGHEGYKIGWDGWKNHVVIPSLPEVCFVGVCISGCRLFSTFSFGDRTGTEMEVYDLSIHGRAKYLSEEIHEGLGEVRFLAPTAALGKLPWDSIDVDGGHDSVVFMDVSVPLSYAMRSSDLLHSGVQTTEDSVEGMVARICAF